MDPNGPIRDIDQFKLEAWGMLVHGKIESVEQLIVLCDLVAVNCGVMSGNDWQVGSPFLLGAPGNGQPQDEMPESFEFDGQNTLVFQSIQ